MGRVVGGAVCCCSVPGGRVASVCAGVCEEGGCVEDCCVSAVATTKGSPTFLKRGLRAPAFAAGSLRFAGAAVLGEVARDLARASAFPKADTAFPKTRKAERQAVHRAVGLLRAGSKERLCLGIFST